MFTDEKVVLTLSTNQIEVAAIKSLRNDPDFFHLPEIQNSNARKIAF